MSDFVFAESFSRYKVASFSDSDLTANFFSRWTNGALGSNSSINGTGRNGACLSLSASEALFVTLPHSARWVTGFAYRIDGNPNASGQDVIYSINNNAQGMFNLRQNFDGTMGIYAGTGVIIDVTDRTLHRGRWYYIEVDVTLSGSPVASCTAELRINGHVEASGTASTAVTVTDLLSQTADANVHRFSPAQGPGIGNSYDDMYIKNFAGYFGDVRIVKLVPNGDGGGGTKQWTPNSGTVHYDRVNTTPVDLTKYVEDATAGHIDSWEWEDCPSFSGTIKAVNIGMLARKDDEGTKSFRIVVGPAGALAQSQDFYVSDVTPEYFETSYQVDPNTGITWTQAGFNATLFGVELRS
jgi:hypothetical protein